MRDAIERILALQAEYSWQNNEPMKERGQLVRGTCRSWLDEALSSLTVEMPEDAQDLTVDASDGVGRKARVPWVRVSSRALAPSARRGWYITYLFAGDGSAAYLVLGQATTETPSTLVELGNAWARDLLGDPPAPATGGPISLAETEGVGATFERGVVEAIRYSAGAVPDEGQLAQDLQSMLSRLALVYDAILRGQGPPEDDGQYWGRRLHEAVSAIDDLTAPSSTKFVAVNDVIVEALGEPNSDRVYTAGVSKPGNLSVRFDQSARSQKARVGVAVLYAEAGLTNTLENARTRVEAGRPANLLLVEEGADDGRWRVAAVVAPPNSPATVKLTHRFPDAEVIAVTTAAVAGSHDAPVVLDERIERLLRASYRSARFVVLVGPPGTGKSRLLGDLLMEAAEEPERFGLKEPPTSVWATPDENWTVRDMVGGDSIVDGEIRFRAGHLLRAIEENRQLVLDELNRADMDRIFGAALTFLAAPPGLEVEVGRRHAGKQAGKVVLRWGALPESRVFEAAFEDGEPTLIYEAGADFRLLGTYNGVDAHQVFRLGQALGRRFQQVPIAPVDAKRFGDLLAPRLDDLDESDRDVVAMTVRRLYEAHLSLFERLVSPASFLDIPAHVAASEGEISERITEGYLAAVGGWLAKQDPIDIDELGRAIVEDDIFTETEWLWVQQLVPLLS